MMNIPYILTCGSKDGSSENAAIINTLLNETTGGYFDGE